MKQPKPPLEKDVQNTICEYLSLKGHCFWRENTLPVYGSVKKSYRTMPKYSLRGVSDIILIRPGGKALFIEVKRKGGVQSEFQVEFQRMVTLMGAEYALVSSLEEVQALDL